MTAALTLSDDQAEAWDRLTAEFAGQGIDLSEGVLLPAAEGKPMVMAVTGKAGSGKTMLLAGLYAALKEAGVEVISADWEGRRRKDRRTLAILAPTNKAASVLRLRGVPATTIHRILYNPRLRPGIRKDRRMAGRPGAAPEGGRADRPGAGPGLRLLRPGRLDPRRAGRRRG